ncbi:DUF3987 domain-containing protein [Escherichia coli]|nr:DUF3987 domain-containing protein [Escherichia coli]EFD3787664.1 DUF3987 domain-containing protein [Escherichia coli]EFJ4489916.1 DUF3987 domain-containing protein [Escherichia coli]EHN1447991.1 DUF3987 domain-containing protein [Escherichia coli]EIZ5851232.1 DUF3987 domain-containing protein [Escherichia coli]
MLDHLNQVQNAPQHIQQGQSASTSSYPVDAFPKVLRDPMTAIHEDTQIPIEMIGSTLLAAAALALQPLINVGSPFSSGKTEPCSLYFLVLAKSGEGKSPLYDLILRPFNKFVSEMQKEYDTRMTQYKSDYAIWKSKGKALERLLQRATTKGGDSEDEATLRYRTHLSTEPKSPRDFKFFYEDTTLAGIIDGLRAYPYAGLFSEDAITFFTGYLKDKLGLLNKIWKNEPFSLSRKKEGYIRIDAFLTILLMIQPDMFENYLANNGKLALSSGFLPRFLFTPSRSTIGKREIKLNQDKTKEALEVFFAEITRLLNLQKGRFYDDTIPVKTMNLTETAKNLFQEKVNQHQENTVPEKSWEHIPEFVSKAGSQAIRIAAMFSYLAHDESIPERTLNDAFTITEWHINQTARYFYSSSRQFQLQKDVYDLFDWINKRFLNPKGVMRFPNNFGVIQEVKLIPWQPFMKNDFETSGLFRLRRVANLEPVLNELIGLGLVVTIKYPPVNTEYIAMAGYDSFGNPGVMYPAIANFIIVKSRTQVPQVLENYDHSRLQWRDVI